MSTRPAPAKRQVPKSKSSAIRWLPESDPAIRSQGNDGAVTTYEARQSWAEVPGDRHSVSANASETQSAKLLAVFVVDTNEIPLGN